MSAWMPIESAPGHWKTLHNEIVVANIRIFHDEDGNPQPPQLLWAHVAYRTCDGWQVGTGGFKHINGFASFRLDEATHWMILPKVGE